MCRKYYPCEYVESVFSLDYRKIYALGFRGVIFDIDNTLVPHGDDSTEEVDRLFEELHRIGLRTALLSDNDEERILRFIANIDTVYVAEAGKPAPEGFLKAAALMELDPDRTLFIGDQVFRDIYGANRAGIRSVLVRFIGHETAKKLGVRRRLEKIVLFFYTRSRKYQHRLGDVLKD